MILGKGDQGRLEYLLDILQKGKPLPDSDQKYLQIMIPLYLGPKDAESYQKNVEIAMEKLHDEVRQLGEKISKLERKGFEKYVGRKAVLFFVTIFVGWNALQAYIGPVLSGFAPSDIISYIFPLSYWLQTISTMRSGMDFICGTCICMAVYWRNTLDKIYRIQKDW